MSSYSKTAQNLLAQKAYMMMLNGMALSEVAKKQGVSIQTISKRIKIAEKTDYIEKVRKRMQVAAADAGTVYEKLLRKKGWKRLSDTDKKLQVRVAGDVLHGTGALTDETQVQGAVQVQISIERPQIASSTAPAMLSKDNAIQPAETPKMIESQPEIAEYSLVEGEKENIVEKEPVLAHTEPSGLTIAGESISKVERNELTI